MQERSLRGRSRTNAYGVESDAKEQIARCDVETLRVRVAKADVSRAHLLFGFPCYIRKLDRSQSLALGDVIRTSPGPAPVVE